MKRLGGLACLGLLVVLTGCSPISVRTDYDEEVDFAAYESFQWMPVLKKKDKRIIKKNSFLDRRIRRAVEHELENRGYHVEVGDATDALLAYHIVVEDHVAVDHYGYRYRGPRYHARRYREGTIIVDIIDSETRELIWRGAASGQVGHPNGDPEQIKVAVAKIFEKYPAE